MTTENDTNSDDNENEEAAAVKPEDNASAVSTPESTSAAMGTGLSEDHVREALKAVIDPELFVNIVDLGLIYTVNVKDREDGKYDVDVEMTMTSPMCPAGPQLVGDSRNAVSGMEQVEEVDIKVVMDPPWTQDMMTDDAKDQLNIF
ncbi:metal-sulfur cluster assembly factor [Pirellulaceae bacterium]|jgi:metal-sulfur cluster biosynthetic enzyme|nr:metal-sulfur cluster assembly factor [Pirellulaceae bacterium]